MSGSNRLKVGDVCDGELCWAIPGVRIIHVERSDVICITGDRGKWTVPANIQGQIRFEKEGFQPKEYDVTQLPERVRLLSNRLIGYQDKLTFFPGEEVIARVHSVVSYRAKLIRHGFSRDSILKIGNQKPSIQTISDKDLVSHGPNWNASFSYRIPIDTKPGLYSLYLEPLSKDLDPFAIPMVISTPVIERGKTSSLLVLASNTTWQSYNIWGGRSRYRNFECHDSSAFHVIDQESYLIRIKSLIKSFLPDVLLKLKQKYTQNSEDGDPWMFERLSVQRPFTNCDLEEEDPCTPFTNHLAAGEWRLLAWLEREGIPYEYASATDLHNDPQLLNSYQGVILSTHCEYWSEKMYSSLKEHHLHHGLWIFNLSGNSIYRQIEFDSDGSTYCKSLSFSSECADETELIGVRYNLHDYGTCAPFKALILDHPLFQSVELSNNRVFGESSLNRNTDVGTQFYNPGRPGSGVSEMKYGLRGEGASGWETDKLAEHRREEFQIIAKGLNKNGGADMIWRDSAGSRGGVFSASSVVFSGSLLIDSVTSTIVKNAFRESGISLSSNKV